jgi:3-deoxy-7-phosphoheptulonate synthase
VPVLKVGRIAGQFAKPRSSDTEAVGELTLPLVPGPHGERHRDSEDARRPEPDRLLTAYHQARPP